MQRVPLSFKLLNRTYQVEEMEEATSVIQGDPHGLHIKDRARIIIDTSTDDRELIVHTFWHEAFHAMFETIGREKLSSDEILVDLLAGALVQILESAQGNLAEEEEES